MMKNVEHTLKLKNMNCLSPSVMEQTWETIDFIHFIFEEIHSIYFK